MKEIDMITVSFYDLGTIEDQNLKFAVICTKYRGKWIFCRHKARSTWEIPGGHIEQGETALEAAAGELQEETGATDFTLKAVCWYQLHFNDGGRGSFSLLCAADVRNMGKLQSEIAEVRPFDEMPSALTYPDIQPCLLAEAIRRGTV
jgi:8-oxo-dGTP diphosphatase